MSRGSLKQFKIKENPESKTKQVAVRYVLNRDILHNRYSDKTQAKEWPTKSRHRLPRSR